MRRSKVGTGLGNIYILANVMLITDMTQFPFTIHRVECTVPGGHYCINVPQTVSDQREMHGLLGRHNDLRLGDLCLVRRKYTNGQGWYCAGPER
jgi:hypothetical protein